MTLRIALSLSVLSKSTAAQAADGTFDRTLAVSGAPAISLSTGSGSITVQ